MIGSSSFILVSSPAFVGLLDQGRIELFESTWSSCILSPGDLLFTRGGILCCTLLEGLSEVLKVLETIGPNQVSGESGDLYGLGLIGTNHFSGDFSGFLKVFGVVATPESSKVYDLRGAPTSCSALGSTFKSCDS